MTQSYLVDAVANSDQYEAFDRVVSTICDYRDLPENWDYEGGRPPSEMTLRFAVDLLGLLRSVPEVTPPTVAPISGGVFLQWELGARRLYFEIEQDSVLTAVCEGGKAQSAEDRGFDRGRAVQAVLDFHRPSMQAG
jgi:hypothetical protein